MLKPQSLSPEEREQVLSEGWLERGWADTKDWLGRWQFWLAELLLAWVVVILTQDATAALLFVLGLASLAWFVATITAPWRQREEARQIAKSFYSPRIHVSHKASKFVSFRDTGTSEALIFLTVSNRGQPTSLTDWAVAPVGGAFKVKLRSRPNMIYNFKSPDRRLVSFEILESESIRNKTFFPIPTGGIVSGILNVWFPDTTVAAILKSDKNAAIAVRYVDAFGEMHEFAVRLCEHVIATEEFPSVPGIKVRVIRREPSTAPQVAQSPPESTGDPSPQQPSQE